MELTWGSAEREVKDRIHMWLGHMLRMQHKGILKKGLRWNPPSKRKQGRPKMTLKKIFEGDFKKMDLTWRTAAREAKERHSWRKRSSCIMDRNNKRRWFIVP